MKSWGRIHIVLLFFSILNQFNSQCFCSTRKKKKKYKPPIKYSAVYIQLAFNDSKKIISEHCSGVLVSETIVLTTAHCFEPINKKKVIPFRVFLGNNSKNNLSSDVENFIIYPEYKNNVYMDISLLHLKRKIIHKTQIIPVLYKENRNKKFLYFYGLSRGVGKLFQAKEIDIKEESRDLINFPDNNPIKNFLVFSNGKELARPGDSGGPLYILRNNKWYVYGLILENSAVFTDIISTNFIKLEPYESWIKAISSKKHSMRL